MPRRKIKLATKVKIMRENLRLIGTRAIPRRYGVSERAAYNWYQRVLQALPDILADDKPGRKPAPKTESAPPF